jgi:hypothetical protein
MTIRRTLAAAALVIAPVVLSAQKPVPVGSVTISKPKVVAELDMNKLKGEPSRLAWSPDGAQLYVQTLEGGFGRPGAKLRHYNVALATGKIDDLQAEPAWVSAYWSVKSDKASPDVPAHEIQPAETQRMERTTSTPMGGDLARGGTDAGAGTGAGASSGSTPDALGAANTTQLVKVISLRLKGELIGEFVNAPLVPGLTFGWGPKGTQVIAYSMPKSGRVVIMDAQGKKQEVAGSKDAVLPAWSQDATQLAWLQKDGRKKVVLNVAGISGS